MANTEETILIPTAIYACEPVESAVRLVHTEIKESGGPSSDHSTDNGIATLAANIMASTCAKLCADGCVRDLHFRTEASSIELPTSPEREMLFDLVSATLATEFIDEVLEKNEEPKNQFKEFELSAVTGEELKKIVEARLNIFNDIELLELISKTGRSSVEQIQTVLQDTLTPIKADVYNDLAAFTKGNIRAALAIVAYFQEVFYKFRSGDQGVVQEAAVIAERGFKPGTPWEITTVDIRSVATLTDPEGFVELPTSAHTATCFYIHDDPSTMKIYQKIDGKLIEVNPNTLPIPITGK